MASIDELFERRACIDGLIVEHVKSYIVSILGQEKLSRMSLIYGDSRVYHARKCLGYSFCGFGMTESNILEHLLYKLDSRLDAKHISSALKELVSSGEICLDLDLYYKCSDCKET